MFKFSKIFFINKNKSLYDVHSYSFPQTRGDGGGLAAGAVETFFLLQNHRKY